MTTLRILILSLLITGCKMYIPNTMPQPEFSFSFHGRVERLEDAFFASGLTYTERDLNRYWQQSPEYEFMITSSDTTINYIVTLGDCQSIYALVLWNNNYECDSSYIHIKEFSSNIDSLPIPPAEAIFKRAVIDPVMKKFDAPGNTYHWILEKKQNTVFVKILNQNNLLRKMYTYSFDSIGNSIAEKEIINYLGDSTIIYKNSPEQRFVYLKTRHVIHK